MRKSDLLEQRIFKNIKGIPAIDVHTHIDLSHLCARGLHDIILYHMAVSDLYSAGMQDGSRLPEEPTEEEAYHRIKQALPYLKYTKNTSSSWGIRMILSDLYGFDEDVTAENWRKLDSLIKKYSTKPGRADYIAKKSSVRKISTELWRSHGKENDMFYYSLEWAFFTRTQWGQFDTALLELEYAWQQDVPGAPLPVNIDRARIKIKRRIKTLDDVEKAIEHYCDKIPYGKVVSTAQHISTDIRYRLVTDDEMARALTKRNTAGIKERDIYANYILEKFLSKLERHCHEIIYQFSIGAEPLPFETQSKLTPETISGLAEILSRHQGLKFQVFLSSEHQNQAMCTLARELPNLSLAGYWWHNFFPGIIRKIIRDRIDMLPVNKQIGFFSDAYCMEWMYAKSMIVRKQLASVLAEKICQGQFSENIALELAGEIMSNEPDMLRNSGT